MGAFSHIYKTADVFALGLALVAVAVAMLAFRTNPAEPIGRFVGTLLLLLFGAEVFMSVGTDSINLHILQFRIVHALVGLACLTAGLVLDALAFPIAPLGERIRRRWLYLFLSGAAALVPLTSLASFARLSPEVLRASWRSDVFLGCIVLRLALLTWLAFACWNAVRRAPPARRFDAKVFATLATCLAIYHYFELWARLFHHFDALRWILVGLEIWYPILGWLMTSPRTYSAAELARSAAEMLLGLAFSLAVALCILHFATHVSLTPFWLGVALVSAVYPASLLRKYVWRRLAGSWADSIQSRCKARLDEVIADEWREEVLREKFCTLVGSLLGGGRIELEFVDSPAEGRLSDVRRLLVEEASQPGWLTPRSVRRRGDPERAELLLCALEAERLSLVVVSRRQAGAAVLFVGEMASLRLITFPMVSLLSELLVTAHTARERIGLAHQAVHNEGLATAGLIASQVSHEARNRLDPVRVALEMLKDGREGELSGEHRALLLREMEMFLAEFNLALDAARTDVVRVSAFAPRGLVEEVLSMFSAYTKARGIGVETSYGHGLVDVAADRRLLRQALFNLMRNAAEALQATETPRIEIRTSASAREFHLEVQDNGPGVSPQLHDRLFSRFSSAKEAGTGIGLSLCREAMSLMGGEIRYLTPKGSPGACFRLTIPVASSG